MTTWPDGYADKSLHHEQPTPPLLPATAEQPIVDWRALYLAERQRADQLAALLKRRHALDPVEVAEALADHQPKDAS